jgi:hypothetical protein
MRARVAASGILEGFAATVGICFGDVGVDGGRGVAVDAVRDGCTTGGGGRFNATFFLQPLPNTQRTANPKLANNRKLTVKPPFESTFTAYAAPSANGIPSGLYFHAIKLPEYRMDAITFDGRSCYFGSGIDYVPEECAS